MQEAEQRFSFKKLFIPLTTFKAIHIIVIVGIIVFGNMLFNSFVYDDDPQIISNPLVHSLSNLRYFFMGGTFFDEGSGQIIGIYYKPLLSTVFALNYTIFGPQPLPFHLFQLLLHIVNAFLIYILFRKFFNITISFIMSIIFLVHPINQEAVGYISALQEVLFFFFGMIALILSTNSSRNIKKIILINVFLFLGLLSKETAILFVPILFLYSYLFNKESFTKIYFFSITITTAFYLYLHFFVAHLAKITNAVLPIMKLSLLERMITMPAILFYYLKNFLWPNELAIQQVWIVKRVTFSQFYFPLITDVLFFLLIGLVGLFLLKSKKKMFFAYLFFLLWFLLGIVMHMQIIPLDATVAARWFYFPIIGLLGLLGTIVSSVTILNKAIKRLAIAVAVIVIILLSGKTIVRNTNWVNTLTLCIHDLPMSTDSYSLQAACASELLKVGRLREAQSHYAIAAKLAPEWGPNWYQYGVSYEYAKDIAKAREYYRKSIQLSNEVNGYVSLASTYLKYENNPQEAKKIVEEGLKSYPNYQRLQLYLAVCEYKLNNKQRALEIATRAYQTDPSPEAVYVLRQISNNEEVRFGKGF